MEIDETRYRLLLAERLLLDLLTMWGRISGDNPPNWCSSSSNFEAVGREIWLFLKDSDTVKQLIEEDV